MAIGVRADVFGNDAEATFTDVEDAVAHLSRHPTFEVIPDGPIRPYGDVEGNAPANITEAEFWEKDAEMMSVLTTFFTQCNRAVAFEKASSYTARRWSVHWFATDCYVASIQHAQHFAKLAYKEFEFPEGIKGDPVPYNKGQKLRHGNTPTAKGEVRPFKLVSGEWKDVFVAYIPKDADLIDFVIPIETRQVGLAFKVEDAELKPLLDCISVKTWSEYQPCMRLIWAMASCGASEGLIHSYCEKAENYGRKWVDNLIRSYNVERSPKFSYIQKMARTDNPKRYCELVFADGTDPKPYVNEIMQLTEDENTVLDTGRYLKPMSFPDKQEGIRTDAIKCPMGCGKTYQTILKVIAMIKVNPSIRILVVSGRRTWSDFIYGEFEKAGIPFTHYEKYKTEQFAKKQGKTTQITDARLILQMSPTAMSLISEQAYDFVIVDECETVLMMMSFLSIYKDTNAWLKMGEKWEALMRETKQVLVMDAFLTDRTMDMLRDLRSGDIHLTINTTQPYAKTCKQFTNKQQFYTALINKFRTEKKKGASIWGTVKAGTEFQEYLTTGKISSVFYHKNSDAVVKARDIADVNTWWATYQSVGYTGTITVGVSYTNKQSPFDFLSLYATCWGGNARDFAQGLHRARDVADNHILAYIDPAIKNDVKGEPGMLAQEKLWMTERSLRLDILKSMNENPQEYSTLPEWWKKVIMRNRNETVVNAKYFQACMTAYMEMCGITTDVLVGPAEKKKTGVCGLPLIEEVRDITPEEAEWLHNNRRGLTEADQFALKKFELTQKVARIDQGIWETWNNDEGVVRNAYNVVHRTPTELFLRQDHKVLDLVNKNIAKMEIIQGCGLDWKTSWVKKMDELPDINLHAFTLRDRSEKDTVEQHWRNVGKAFERFGLNVSVLRKRVKVRGENDYVYSVAFSREKSVIDYIHPKLDITTVFQD